jgi:hypothetical protein
MRFNEAIKIKVATLGLLLYNTNANYSPNIEVLITSKHTYTSKLVFKQ